jgi:hypothetical protein
MLHESEFLQILEHLGRSTGGVPRGRVYTKHICILIPDVSPLREDAAGISTNYYHSGICLS